MLGQNFKRPDYRARFGKTEKLVKLSHLGFLKSSNGDQKLEKRKSTKLSSIEKFFRFTHHSLKITKKVAFKIASETSYVYILSRQKFIKNGQSGEFLKS